MKNTFQELEYWNNNSYGKAYVIQRKYLILTLITLCIITPFTNWLIPIIPRLIKTNIKVRYE